MTWNSTFDLLTDVWPIIKRINPKAIRETIAGHLLLRLVKDGAELGDLLDIDPLVKQVAHQIGYFGERPAYRLQLPKDRLQSRLMNWLGRSTPETMLVKSLGDYPCYQAPFTAQQARDDLACAKKNHEFFLYSIQDRLTVIADLLSKFEIDLRAGIKADHWEPMMAQLTVWARQTWPSVAKPGRIDYQSWLSSNRKGEQIVHSLIVDLAIAFGELIKKHHPNFEWILNEDPDDWELYSFRRSILYGLPINRDSRPVSFDLEMVLFHEFETAWSGNRFFASIESLLRGYYARTVFIDDEADD